MSADQAACVYPHKPQLAKIRFLKQSHNSIDVVLTCHCLLASRNTLFYLPILYNQVVFHARTNT
nr:MAG TPA: hypothetical protein [Caudoviricetes sp.]